MNQIDELLAHGRDAMTVGRVFGDPIERDGVTIIPVANVMGGGGGGGDAASFQMGAAADQTASDGDADPEASTGPTATERGLGAGFGIRATPAGVYVITDGRVRWEPALDLTRIAIMGQIVAIVLLLVVRSVLRSRGG
jgi:uncharacterized spore protein YtfJ